MARSERLSVPIEKNLRKKTQAWARREGRTEADLYHQLLSWACEQYAHVGDLAALRKMSVRKRKETT